MKTNYFLKKITPLMICIILVGISCKDDKKDSDEINLTKIRENFDQVTHTVNPTVLELIGDEIAVSVVSGYPSDYLNDNVVLTITPVLVNESDEMEFSPYQIQGNSVKNNNDVVKQADGTFKYSLKFPYDSQFQISRLMLRASASIGSKTIDMESVKLADGIVATCLLVEKNGKASYAPDNYVRITPLTYTSDIKYLMCQSWVRSSETKKPEIMAFTIAVKAAQADERTRFTAAHITGYSAPRDDCDDNEMLANDRLTTGKDFFIKNFNAAGVEEIVKSVFLTESVVPDDWDGFKKLMQESNIADKALVLRVLSMYSDPVVRKREIKNLAVAYDEIKVKIFPQLDRTEMTVNTAVIGLSDQEINAQFDSDPSKLKLEEILYAGTLTQDPYRKLSIYQAAARYYPSDYRTKNNLGVALLNLGRTSEAKTALNDAKNIDNNEIVKNNLAVVALREGNIIAAEELLNAAGSSDDVKFNLGTIKIIQGKYSEAVSCFGNQVEINAALAKLLAKQNDAALSILNSVKSGDALVHYLKAVVGARTGNADLLMNNLRTACSMSPKLKANAAKDIEFVNYFDDGTFKSIIQ